MKMISIAERFLCFLNAAVALFQKSINKIELR